MTIHIDVCKVMSSVQIFVWKEIAEDESVRDENHANLIMDQLVGNGSAIIAQNPAEVADSVTWFRILLTVNDTHRDWANYTADYMRMDGCPAVISEHAMVVYRTIRGVLRESKQDYRDRRRAKKEVK